MNNSAVHQSLIELEENLSNLESARTQVENISEKSEQIILSFTKVLKAIESIKIDFEGEKSVFDEAISSSLNSFNNTIESEASVFVEKLGELNKSIANYANKSIQDLSAFQTNIENKRGHLNSAIDKSIGDLNSAIESQTLEFAEKSVEQNQIFSNAINESVQKVDTFSLNVDEATNKIMNFNFENSVINLIEKLVDNNNAIETLKLAQMKSSTWTKRILIVGFLAVITTLFVFKFDSFILKLF